MRSLGLQLVVIVAISLLGRSAWCGHVVVLQPVAENSEGWHASTHAMIAELALAGFTVSVQHLEPNAELLETLPRVANRQGVIAAVSVTRREEISVGYLWLKQADGVVIVEERANQAVVAHSVVVLKLAELLLEHQLHLPSPDSAGLQSSDPQVSDPPPRESTRETSASNGPSEGELVFCSWLGAGVDTLGVTRAHAWQLGASAELQVLPRFSLTAGVSFPLSSHELDVAVNSEQSSELGSDLGAEVHATEVGGGVLFGVFDVSRVSVVLGPRVGLRFLQARGSPSTEYAGQRAFSRVLTLGADVRGVYRLASAVNLGLLLRGSWLTPEPRLTSDSGAVATLGAVAWSGQFMIGWELGL